MENWGLITYRETALLYNPDFSTTADKQQVARVVAHELAHMVVQFHFEFNFPHFDSIFYM